MTEWMAEYTGERYHNDNFSFLNDTQNSWWESHRQTSNKLEIFAMVDFFLEEITYNFQLFFNYLALLLDGFYLSNFEIPDCPKISQHLLFFIQIINSIFCYLYRLFYF